MGLQADGTYPKHILVFSRSRCLFVVVQHRSLLDSFMLLEMEETLENVNCYYHASH